MKHVKLTAEGLEKLRQILGLEDGIIRLQNGIICLEDNVDSDVIQKIHQNFGIDNIDHVPYGKKALASLKTAETLNERVLIIGSEIRVGSIVRIRTSDAVTHVVVISINGDKYECAKMNLKVDEAKPCRENALRLTKGNDVIYRNATYKNVVEVTSETISAGMHEFIRHSGGLFVGRIINELTMSKIIKLCALSEEVNLEENQNPQSEETNVEEHLGEKTHFAEQVEEAKSSDELLDQNDEERAAITLEKSLEEISGFDELIVALNISGEYLKEAMAICIEAQRCNLKSLYAELQSRQKKSPSLSRNAIKNLLTEEFVSWCDSENVAMKECTLSYFLKTVVKGVKNK